MALEAGWYGLGAAGPDYAGAYAPGYGRWLEEQRNRDWDQFRRMRPYHELKAAQSDVRFGLIAVREYARIRSMKWYTWPKPDSHIRAEEKLQRDMARLGRLVGGGDPYAP